MALPFGITLEHLLIVALFIFAGLVFLLLALKFAFKLGTLLKTALTNSIVGMLMLLLLYLINVQIPINLATLVIIALFGLAGLGTILVLKFAGMLI